MKNWLRLHAYALTGAWRHIRAPRGGFILNVVVIAIALMLPFAGLTLLQNVRPVSEQLVVEPEISIFLAAATSREQANALAAPIKRLLKDAQLDGKLEFIPREKALAALDERTGLSAAVNALGSNPLPDAYVLKLSGLDSMAQAARTENLVGSLQALSGVEHVQLDSAWVKRLAAIMHVLQMALLLLAITLGTVVVAVVFNTLRLQVLNQSEEIVLSKLVGAADSFVYRPFYYAGAFLGLIAGALALVLVTLALHPLNQALAEVVRLYGSQFRLLPLDALSWIALLVLSAGLGWLGALLSVRRSIGRLA
ncbi:cell division transport system permease protein [Paucimonas lemoignei]|uniref:Cell division protein FtsX n=1 Tax=Paucimonas lemoignei TaxID=29443 RepID=A0A4R3HW69_PAULE|nr:permease-like cell division protein FtsX [Paucimonas lemoignei]TCS37024.1 cell division transport system permease protein [Paucimonas lemoignei]